MDRVHSISSNLALLQSVYDIGQQDRLDPIGSFFSFTDEPFRDKGALSKDLGLWYDMGNLYI
ncbi:hypothetical protein AMS62_01595 [Bacillus sp. FJAT-18019]|nr:hypothetical protein AMS62_01595 [Bacillus sp. FJAT-18019]